MNLKLNAMRKKPNKKEYILYTIYMKVLENADPYI